jgi:predicted HD superfamily hydrolase involved in NAD metabolism
MTNTITDQMLDKLRGELSAKMSEKRYNHTVMVEQMATLLGNIYAPDNINNLRAAALLHDITKEYSDTKHHEIFKSYNYKIDDINFYSPKCNHAVSAYLLVPFSYGNFANETVLNAIRYHTTGKANMTITEKIIYLADYIDLSRTFDDCVTLRNYFFEKYSDKMTKVELSVLLNDTLILSFDMTIKTLVSEGELIAPNTINARNFLIMERKHKNEQ